MSCSRKYFLSSNLFVICMYMVEHVYCFLTPYSNSPCSGLSKTFSLCSLLSRGNKRITVARKSISLYSRLSANENDRLLLMKATVPAVLQSVGLYRSAEMENKVLFENEGDSLRIESWGGDSSDNGPRDDRTLLLWLPGLDGTSLTGEDRF